MYYAITEGKTEAVRILLENTHHDLLIRPYKLAWAALKRGRSEILRILMTNDEFAQIFRTYPNEQSALDDSESFKERTGHNPSDSSEIFIATAIADNQRLQELLNSGADVNYQDCRCVSLRFYEHSSK